jgi:hypothetical protein
MAEDRGIEEYGRLQRLIEKEGIYRQLTELFRHADRRYNSGLFDFSKSGDRLTPSLSLDDRAIKNVLADLYFPQSPYEFSVLPVEILGNVYEQFLGKVIRLTAGHQAKVEEKPEVKKAGGVYYTPAYIVDYIVKNTVGALVDGRSPNQLKGFRVLDPACGSGSFLLAAYEFLLDHYLRWYTANSPEKCRKAVYRLRGTGASSADWHLTSKEKKRILTEHIFGVDIDRQAVEVTKLSLLLKVLETESGVTLAQQLTLLPDEPKERALPNLEQNIKCGNSLIGPDYFSGRLLPDAEELARVNAFDWKSAFPEAMAAGGFDAVIGNPPYIRIQTLKEWAPLEVEAYKELYRSAGSGNYDIYLLFAEKGLALLQSTGLLGFILPNKLLKAKHGAQLRKSISGGQHLRHIVDFGGSQVFEGATTYTCVLIMSEEPSPECNYVQASDLTAWRQGKPTPQRAIPASRITSGEWNFVADPSSELIHRLAAYPTTLHDISERIFQGIIPGADKVYTVELLSTRRGVARCFSRALDQEIVLESDLLRRIVTGKEVKRYSVIESPWRVVFPYKLDARGNAELIPPGEMAEKYPRTHKYFESTRTLLNLRDRGSARGPEWYKYIRSQNIGLQGMPKLAVPRLVARLCCGFDHDGSYCLDNVDVGGVLVRTTAGQTPLFLMGLINSRLLDLVFRKASVPFRGAYFSANRQYIEKLPIRTIDFSDPADKARHDKMVALVECMLELHKRKQAAGSDHERELLQRQIASTDGEIDALVYELYGLTEDEIAVVEDAVHARTA